MTSSLSRHPAFLSLQGGINFRDLGGQLAADGRRVRSGKLLRSGALNRLTAEDLNHLDTLPLSRVLDYRDPGEVARTPDKLSPLTHYLNAPANPPVSEVNAKVTELNAATLNALNGEQFMLQLYRQLPFNNPAYRQLAAWLTTPFEGALLQHCAVGKDRTGVGCALTLVRRRLRQRNGDGGVSPYPRHADAGGGLDVGAARQRPHCPGAPKPGGYSDGKRVLSRRRAVGYSPALWHRRRLAGGRVPAYGAGSRRAAGPAAGRVTARFPRGERCFGRLPDRGSRGDREKM